MWAASSLLPRVQAATIELLGCYLIRIGHNATQVQWQLQKFEVVSSSNRLQMLDRWSCIWQAKQNEWIWSSPDDDDEYMHYRHYARYASVFFKEYCQNLLT
jgi:hypothetical protein